MCVFMSVHVYLCVCECLSMCVYLHVNIGACHGQKERINAIKLVILMIMFWSIWMLGHKMRSLEEKYTVLTTETSL